MEDLKKKWTDRGHLTKDFPEENLETVLDRFETIEKWEKKRRKTGGAFNEQFCADVYAVASITARDNSFKGKFNPDELYEEMKTTMKTMRKGKTDYSLYDEAKMLTQVMDNHKKKTPTKK